MQEIQKDLVKEKEERQKLIESQKENVEAEVKERTKEILSKAAYLPLQSQKEVILTQMTNFQGDSEQRDDILVVSVKL